MKDRKKWLADVAAWHAKYGAVSGTASRSSHSSHGEDGPDRKAGLEVQSTDAAPGCLE